MLCENDESTLNKLRVETPNLGKRQEKNLQRATKKIKNHGLPGNKLNKFHVIVVKTLATCFSEFIGQV